MNDRQRYINSLVSQGLSDQQILDLLKEWDKANGHDVEKTQPLEVEENPYQSIDETNDSEEVYNRYLSERDFINVDGQKVYRDEYDNFAGKPSEVFTFTVKDTI